MFRISYHSIFLFQPSLSSGRITICNSALATEKEVMQNCKFTNTTFTKVLNFLNNLLQRMMVDKNALNSFILLLPIESEFIWHVKLEIWRLDVMCKKVLKGNTLTWEIKHENENYEIGSSHTVVLCLLCNKDDYRFLRTLTKTVQVGNSSRLCQ